MKRRRFIAVLGRAVALPGDGARAAGPNAAACWPTRLILADLVPGADAVIE
jgi:hypothetical protein